MIKIEYFSCLRFKVDCEASEQGYSINEQVFTARKSSGSRIPVKSQKTDKESPRQSQRSSLVDTSRKKTHLNILKQKFKSSQNKVDKTETNTNFEAHTSRRVTERKQSENAKAEGSLGKKPKIPLTKGSLGTKPKPSLRKGSLETKPKPPLRKAATINPAGQVLKKNVVSLNKS